MISVGGKALRKILLSWSSGKDSAWTLQMLLQDPENQVIGLLTNFNSAADRVSMHAVRRRLVLAQAERAGIPLWPIELPWPCSNAHYEEQMRGAVARARAEQVAAIAFGDLFLEDIRAYRVRQLQGTGLEPLFPLWKIPTDQLSREMLAGGLRAKITCIDKAKLPLSFAGREYDEKLLEELPPEVDPCGENGEFHSFAYAGPMFTRPIEVRCGETLERDGFIFADLVPTSASADSHSQCAQARA